ncbi:hypothetical protein [Rhodoferax aquaticus]|uniref:hypothetical protein n=1 Tax=Rhodoferax aquaticus TaxID=2527691 RepID=UPI00115C604C|nr:hypothetical protein [Rhodoferax aquaticus]
MPEPINKADLDRLVASLIEMRDTLTNLSLAMKDLAFETLHAGDEDLAETLRQLIDKAKQGAPPSGPNSSTD